MGRQPCCDKRGLKRGPWTIEEDHKLMNFILNNGIQCWRLVPKLAGLPRCGKSCRLRWINYLRPDLKRGAITEAEEEMIIRLHARFGNRWSKIASHFPGRTDNEIKNHWNTRIKKKLKVLGLDPVTHNPIEQHENCKAKHEGIQQSSSSREQEDNLELNSHDNSSSKDNQMSEREGKSSFGLDETNLSSINQVWESLEAGSMLKPEADPSNVFPVGIDEDLPADFLQQWIDSPSHMLSWDGFNNLEEILL
ncbi:hypothetical protein F0562_034204 [Nyssa sinensis]|uniref:Uncharacterized protein n=1 Tax=Nyssa sinensis TaxID=561372 RepID=A0A5J5AJ18_9ASTE|nr:hypothetical protein F0562_034204 [Nyssa sinensis]